METRERLLEMLLARQSRREHGFRMRLARMLHDGAAQQATALRMDLRRLVPGTAVNSGVSAQLLDLSSQLNQNLLDLAAELQTADAAGLTAAVAARVRAFQRVSGIAVQYRGQPVCCSETTARSLLDVLDEALDNVGAHASADAVSVTLEPAGASLSLVVADNGRGFAIVDESARHAGILTMRERTLAAGGRLEVLSRNGGGTKVLASFPSTDGEAALEPPALRTAAAVPDASNVAAPSRPIRVLVADDHPIVRRGLKQILCEQPGVRVEEADSFPVLRDYLTRSTPDVLVLDINMPGGYGFDMLSELNRLYPRLPVLVLSVQPEEVAGVRAIRAGARGYLTKDAAPEHLVTAVRKLSAQGRYFSGRLAEALAEFVQTPRSALAPHHQLSSRELAVLLLIAAGKSTAAIGEHLHISPKTVATYRARIFEKLGMKSAADLTRYVIENRLSAGPPRPPAPEAGEEDRS